MKKIKFIHQGIATMSLLFIALMISFLSPVNAKTAQAVVITPDIVVVRPVNDTTLNSNNVTLEYTVSNLEPAASTTQTASSCWFDLGSRDKLIDAPGYLPDINDPVDSNYRYYLSDCHNGVNTKTLVFPDGDYVYNLYAANGNASFNFDSSWFKVNTENTAVVIKSLMAKEITSKSAIIQWSTNREALGRTPYGREIYWPNYLEVQPGPTGKKILGSTTGESVYQTNLSDLKPETKYHVRLYIEDAPGGTVLAYKDITFVTAKSVEQNIYSLTVNKKGTGGGTVYSSNQGINCGEDCSEKYAKDSAQTLKATPDKSSKFVAWQGDCEASAADGRACVIKMNNNKTLIAVFDKVTTVSNDVEVSTATNDNLESLLAEIKTLRNRVQEQETQIKYLKNLVSGVKPISDEAKETLTNFITYGADSNTKKLGAGERAAVVSSYKAAYNKLPEPRAEVAETIKIANGGFPSVVSADAEAQAKAAFKKIYKREMNSDNKNDVAAIKVMAYGLRQKAENRKLISEENGIKIFNSIYGHTPNTTEEWNIMQAITYSGAKR